MNQTKKKSSTLIASVICNIFLFCALTACLFALIHKSKITSDLTPPIQPDVPTIADEPLDAPDDMIPIKLFQKYALEYNVPTEFIQRFFPGHLVYPENKAFHYVPVDFTLPQNDFNWDNLVHMENEKQYHKDGSSIGIKGIDVSEYQGEIDWKKVKNDGVSFAIVRLGYRGYGTGKIVLDQFYEKNMKNASAAGIDTGVYFFSQALSTEEAIEEAKLVVEQIKAFEVTYPLILDVEDVPSDARTSHLTRDDYTDIVIAFCDEISKSGYTPMIYANTKWFASRLDLTRLTKYQKWFAQYYKVPFFPYEFQIWQYSAKGIVDGIKGDVDLNISFVDYSTKS